MAIWRSWGGQPPSWGQQASLSSVQRRRRRRRGWYSLCGVVWYRTLRVMPYQLVQCTGKSQPQILTWQLFLACLPSHQHASVPQGQICSDMCMCCHTEIEVADQTFYLTSSQYTDNGPTSPSTDPVLPGARHGSNWSTSYDLTQTKIRGESENRIEVCRSQGGRLTTKPKTWITWQTCSAEPMASSTDSCPKCSPEKGSTTGM